MIKSIQYQHIVSHYAARGLILMLPKQLEAKRKRQNALKERLYGGCESLYNTQATSIADPSVVRDFLTDENPLLSNTELRAALKLEQILPQERGPLMQSHRNPLSEENLERIRG